MFRKLLAFLACALASAGTGAETIAGLSLVAKAAEQLRAAIGPAELRALGTPRDVEVSSAEARIDAQPAPWSPGQRRARVDMRVLVPGRAELTVPVWFEVRSAAANGDAWVQRQQSVVLEVRVADIVIESPALALADGREGEVIQVRMSSGGAIRPARVVAPGRVAL